ncbi:MAG: hypothetical protein ACI4I6_06480 [Hominimerdicola sp.]
MKNTKIRNTDINSAVEAYNSLDVGAQHIAMAILELVSMLFLNIYQVQNINKNNKE